MALRIRLPPLGAAKPSTSSVPQDMEEPVSSKRARKPTKRYLQSSDDERAPIEPVRKVRRTSTADKPKPKRRQSVAHSEPGSNPDVENDIDIENDADEGEGEIQSQEQEQFDDHRSEHSVQQSTTSSRDRTSKSKMKALANVPVSRKKMGRKVVVSDSEEEEEEYVEPVQEPIPELDEEEDDDYISSDNNHTKSKGKGKATSAKGTKRKAKGDPDDSHLSGVEKKGSLKGSAVAKKKLKPSLRLDENIIDVVGNSIGTPEASATVEQSSPATAKQDSPAPAAPPPPKKLKLPTIKKNKLPGTPSIGTPTSATSTSKKPLLELGLPSKLNHDDVRKTMIGNTDIDLSNKSIYQELFLKTGSGDGNTPRRAREEERRKELNRMREEAKAKRAAEARHSFDLQAQYDKIQLFEEKLKAAKSSALYPSFLASKCRQVYDKERRQKAQEMSGRETEEGEVA